MEAGKSLEESYKLATEYILKWSKRISGPNGLAPTHDSAHVVAKFKTEQPVRSTFYATHINSLVDEGDRSVSASTREV